VRIANAEGEEFDENRLFETLRESEALTADALQKRVLSSVAEFTHGEFQDDATLIVIAVR
jgi:serine phosphatase RsbU (regulator of sigma subunit)